MVFLYLLAVPGIGPLALGLLSHDMGGYDHELQIAAVDGHFDLVLHHAHDDEVTTSPLQEDATPWLSCDDGDDHHGDHVVHFTFSNPLPSSAAAKSLAFQNLVITAPSWSDHSTPSPWSHARVDKMLRGRPPPGGLALVTILRTTVFLV